MSQKAFSKPRTRGLASGWGTIWILVIVVVVAAAGVLAWQQLQAPAEEPVAEEKQPSGEEAEAPQEEAQPPIDETGGWPASNASGEASAGWKPYGVQLVRWSW